MPAVGTPTSRLRLVGKTLQQRYEVVYDAGTAKERKAHVWLDVPKEVESSEQRRARLEVQAMGSEFTIVMRGNT